MNFNEHLTVAKMVMHDFGQFIETHSSKHAFPISVLPYEKQVIKNAIIITALDDRSETNMDFCRLALHILATSIDDTEAEFVNDYFSTATRGDVDAVDALDVPRWNKLRAKIYMEFAAYESELRQLLNQVAMLA